MNSPSHVTTGQVFAIAGPAMIANLTTPLIGIVSTTAIGRLGDATHFADLGHEIRVGLAMALDVAGVEPPLLHQVLLGREVMEGVARQAIEHPGQFLRLDFPAAHGPLGKDVDQVNQLVMLGIHLVEAGFKIIRPLEGHDRRAGPHSAPPSILCS